MNEYNNEATIGKLANYANVSVETVRFYQRSGLLEVPESRAKMRYYAGEHLRRLTFIKKAKLAGFTLKEISQLLDFDARADRSQARALAKQRLAQIDQQLETLMTARSALTKLVVGCGSGEQGPCPILEALEFDVSILDK
jgi:MerR family mercuric resistance operon transcriptional regulator